MRCAEVRLKDKTYDPVVVYRGVTSIQVEGFFISINYTEGEEHQSMIYPADAIVHVFAFEEEA